MNTNFLADVFAVHPAGGQPDMATQYGTKIINATELAPLSVSLNTIARIRPSTKSAQMVASPQITFVSIAESLTSSFKPTSPAASRQTSPSLSPVHAARRPSKTVGNIGRQKDNLVTQVYRLQDALVFQPDEDRVVLARLTAHEASSLSTGGTLAAAASRGDVGRLATTAVSGLTQLMKSRGGQTAPLQQPHKPEFVVGCSAKACWDIKEGSDAEYTGTALEKLDSGFARDSKNQPQR